MNLRICLLVSVFLFLAVGLYAQGVVPAVKKGSPTVAVLPFIGDKTVTPEQLNFITGQFTSELISTGKFTVLDRGKMDFILKEQGFQQTGACNNSECKVQVGQLLGVDNLVAGNMVKFGSKYAFRLEYIDVRTGQMLKTVEFSKEGDLSEVYEAVCSEAARKLSEAVYKTESVSPESGAKKVTPVVPADALPMRVSKPLSLKRKIAIGLWGSALLGAGGGYWFDSKGKDYAKDYDGAKTLGDSLQASVAYHNINNAKTDRAVSYGISIGTLILGAILWFLPEGDSK